MRSVLLVLAVFWAIGAEAADCANLSGKWTGMCTQTVGDPFQYTMDVVQKDCTHWIEDGQSEIIGGLSSTQATSDKARAHVGSLQWSTDGQSLLWEATTFSKDPATGISAGELGTGSYALQNGHFMLNSKFRVVTRTADSLSDSEETYVCDMILAPPGQRVSQARVGGPGLAGN